MKKPVTICDHKDSYPVGGMDANGMFVWYCPDPPKGCGKTIGKRPAIRAALEETKMNWGKAE